VDPAPYYADVADGPAGARAVWLRTADACRLRLGVFDRPQARGTVLILPGRTEYIEKYAPLAAEFGRRGYAAAAIDWRGQGLSDRPLPGRPMVGHVRRFTDYQFDLAAMTEAAVALRLPRPWYMVAHSMGGAVGLRALCEGKEVAAAVFSAPMWDILLPPPAGRLRAHLVSGAARLAGLADRPVPGTSRRNYLADTAFDDNALTTDRAMWEWMRAQITRHPDLALGGPSLLWLNEALREIRRLRAMPAPVVPCLTVLGTREAIVDASAIRLRMGRWPLGRLSHYEGARHEIPMEAPAFRARFYDEADALFEENRGGARAIAVRRAPA
jgi:lysophospholipase